MPRAPASCLEREKVQSSDVFGNARIQRACHLHFLHAIASTLAARASNLIAVASNLVAMAPMQKHLLAQQKPRLRTFVNPINPMGDLPHAAFLRMIAAMAVLPQTRPGRPRGEEVS